MPSHPPYNEMVIAAITSHGDRAGSSRQAIIKYITENYDISTARYDLSIKQALKRLVSGNTIIQTKGSGASGSFMLSKKKNTSAPKRTLKKAPEIENDEVSDTEARNGRSTRKKGIVAKAGGASAEDSDKEDEPRRKTGRRVTKGMKVGGAEKIEGRKTVEHKTPAVPKGGKRKAGPGRKAGKRVVKGTRDTSEDVYAFSDEELEAEGKVAAVPKGIKKTAGRGVAKGTRKGVDTSEDVSDEEIEAEGKVAAVPKGVKRKAGRGVAKGTKKGDVLSAGTGEDVDTVGDEEMEVEQKDEGKSKAASKPLGKKKTGKGIQKKRDAPQVSEDTVNDNDDESRSTTAAKPKKGKGKSGKRVAKTGDKNAGGDEEMVITPEMIKQKVAESHDANSTVGDKNSSSQLASKQGDAGQDVSESSSVYYSDTGSDSASEGRAQKGAAVEDVEDTVSDKEGMEVGVITTTTNSKGGNGTKEDGVDSSEDTISEEEKSTAKQKGAAKRPAKRNLKERKAAKKPKNE